MNKLIWLYLSSAILAITLALVEGVSEKIPIPLANDIAIIINDSSIERVDYLTAVTMMTEEKTQPMRAVDYQLIVDRLTEEELLFQYGLAQGYIYQPAISQVIVSNLLATIAVQHTSKQYSDEELHIIYLDKIVKDNEPSQVDERLSFANLKPQLATALREIERSKTVRDYLTWLRQRADFVYSNHIKEGNDE